MKKTILCVLILMLSWGLKSQSTRDTLITKLRIAYVNGVAKPDVIVIGNTSYSVSKHELDSNYATYFVESGWPKVEEMYGILLQFDSLEMALYNQRKDITSFTEDDPCGRAFMNAYYETDKVPGYLPCFGRSYSVERFRSTDDRMFYSLKSGRKYYSVSFPLQDSVIKANYHKSMLNELEEQSYYSKLVSENGFKIEDVEYIYSNFTNGPSVGMDKKLVDVYVQDEELVYNYYIENQKVAQYMQTYNVNEYIIFTFAWDDSGKITDVRREEF